MQGIASPALAGSPQSGAGYLASYSGARFILGVVLVGHAVDAEVLANTCQVTYVGALRVQGAAGYTACRHNIVPFESRYTS